MSSVDRLKILLAGETWFSYGVHSKGFAAYTTGGYEEGHQPLTDALREHGHAVEVMPNHLATRDFPWRRADLAPYDLVILSDIPSDTLLLHPDAFTGGRTTPNRLVELAEWVRLDGGGLLMVGGYMSFSGFEGKANYHFTALADVLPVGMHGFDDRVEAPQGVVPESVADDHEVLAGVGGGWPVFLGYNKLRRLDSASVVVECSGDPFLAVRDVGAGRTAAFASDCSPHWGSPDFLAWEHYGRLWDNLVRWTAAGKADDPRR